MTLKEKIAEMHKQVMQKYITRGVTITKTADFEHTVSATITQTVDTTIRQLTSLNILTRIPNQPEIEAIKTRALDDCRGYKNGMTSSFGYYHSLAIELTKEEEKINAYDWKDRIRYWFFRVFTTLSIGLSFIFLAWVADHWFNMQFMFLHKKPDSAQEFPITNPNINNPTEPKELKLDKVTKPDPVPTESLPKKTTK